jgi:hypothetical protein
MQVGSLHMYDQDLNRFNLAKNEKILITSFTDNNWQVFLEEKLLKALRNEN